MREDSSSIVFFDIGGTLMEGPNLSPGRRFVMELGLEPGSGEKINDFIFTCNCEDVPSLAALFYERFPGLSPAALQKIAGVWESQLDDGYVLDGSFTLLEKLEKAGVRLGIISNIWKPYFICFERLFSKYMHLFDVVALSFQAGAAKPDPMIFREALAMAGEPDPGSACMVGDSYFHDVAPSLEAGMKPVWILQNPRRESPFVQDVESGRIPPPALQADTIAQLTGERFEDLLALLPVAR